MIRRRAGAWVYFAVSPEVWAEIGPFPHEKTEDTEMVKINPVRVVYRRGDCFYKLEIPKAANLVTFFGAIFRPKAKSEFRTLRMLERYGVPVTPPLAAGQASTVSMLVTRAIPGSVSVGDYAARHFVRAGEDPWPFLTRWAEFVRKFVDSPFFHPDFHNGNILYREATGEFALVDVYGVVYAVLIDRATRRHIMYRILHEFREFLDRDGMLRLIELAGAAADRAGAEQFYRRLLIRTARHAAREGKKRRRQFLANYAKFIEKATWDGREILLHLDAGREPRAKVAELAGGSYEIVTGAAAELEALRLCDFELARHLIPHCCVVAYDPAKGALYREKGEGAAIETPEWLEERLRIAGFRPEEFECVRDRFGRIAVK